MVNFYWNVFLVRLLFQLLKAAESGSTAQPTVAELSAVVKAILLYASQHFVQEELQILLFVLHSAKRPL